MELLWNHYSPHDSIDEEREEDIAKEDEDAHQDSNESLLCGIHCQLVDTPQK